MVTEIEEHPHPVPLSQSHSDPSSQGLHPPGPFLPQLSQPWCDPHFEASAILGPRSREKEGGPGRSPSIPGTEPAPLRQAPAEAHTPQASGLGSASPSALPWLSGPALPTPHQGSMRISTRAVQSRTTQEQLKAAPLCFSFSTE